MQQFMPNLRNYYETAVSQLNGRRADRRQV
jgi:hypothetical protein